MFVAAELRAGRWPLWVSGQYAGKPVLQWPWLSPLSIMLAAIPSPMVLAWHQLLAAIIAGAGFYLFCRRALGVGFWPAVITAWNYPMTGFFVFWLGYPTSAPVYWLPWLLLAVDRWFANPTGEEWPRSPWRPARCCAIGSSTSPRRYSSSAASTDYGGPTKPTASNVCDVRRARRRSSPSPGWLLGFSLAAPYVMPIVEYASSGARTAERAAGFEERAPGGLGALPLLVLPDLNGSTRKVATHCRPLPGRKHVRGVCGPRGDTLPGASRLA